MKSEELGKQLAEKTAKEIARGLSEIPPFWWFLEFMLRLIGIKPKQPIGWIEFKGDRRNALIASENMQGDFLVWGRLP